MTSSKFWLSSPFPFFIIRSNRQSNSIHSITFTLVSLQRYGKIEAILAPHKTGKVLTWAEENNVELVFTLTNASWLNPMECHFRSFKKFAILNSNYKSRKEQVRAIRRYIAWRNREAKKD